MKKILLLFFIFSFINVSFAQEKLVNQNLAKDSRNVNLPKCTMNTANYDTLIKTNKHSSQQIVIINNKYGIIQKNRIILPVEYDHIKESKYNYIIKKNGKYGLFDGYKSKTNIEYDSIKKAGFTPGYNFDKDYYAVEKNHKFGCLAYDKKFSKYTQFLEIKYDDIVAIGDKDSSFAVKLDNKYAIINPNKKKEAKFVYNDFKKTKKLVKVKKGCLWYYKDPEEYLKNLFKPLQDIGILLIWHLGSL